jgi:hypothetical protein
MRIGLVGGTKQEWSLPFDAQRTVNLYPVLNEEGKEVSALYSTPGLSLFSDIETGQTRGMYYASNGRAFAVIGSTLYEFFASGSTTNRGSLLNSAGAVSIADNGFQLAVCDGVNLYIFTYSTNTFAKVSDTDLPEVGYVTFIDGYFVVNKLNSQSFYISTQYDGTLWAALDFASAESSPDELKCVYNAVGQLWLLGEFTTEVFTNTGSSAFPFEKIQGGKIDVGCIATHSVLEVGGTLLWLGQDKFGSGGVYQTTGFSPNKISTSPIELLIKSATDKENIKAWAYQENGHTFYCLTGGGLTTTLVYDLTTGIWHERSYFNSYGEHETSLVCCHVFAFGKHIVGDRNIGRLYEMSSDIYSDNGDEICRERIYTHLFDEGTRIRFNTLEIGFETGTGLQSGQGSDPKVMFSLSKDGGKTWSDEYSTTFGKVGKYRTTVQFRRLGVASQMTFKIRVTDPVKVAIIGSYLK